MNFLWFTKQYRQMNAILLNLIENKLQKSNENNISKMTK